MLIKINTCLSLRRIGVKLFKSMMCMHPKENPYQGLSSLRVCLTGEGELTVQECIKAVRI